MLLSDAFVAVTVTVRLAITTACFMYLHENCVGCGSGGVKRKKKHPYLSTEVIGHC